MANKKNWNQLTEQGKKARLTHYAKIREQYGLSNGLFTVNHIVDHGVVHTKRGDRLSYGFHMVPAGIENCDDKSLKDGQWIWMSELVQDTDKAQKQFIPMHQDWIKALKYGLVKSLLFSVDYKRNGKYFNIYNLRFQDQAKLDAAMADAAQSTKQADNTDEDVQDLAASDNDLSQDDLPFDAE